MNRFLSIKTKEIKNDTVHLHFLSSKIYSLPVVPAQITPDASIQSIQQHKENVLSGYRYAGAGKVGFQLLKETYRIRLEGNEDDYAFIWTDLIERTARSGNEMFTMKLTNRFPYYPDEPLSVDIISSGTQPVLYNEKNNVPLMEDVIIDDYWRGKSWAGESGWHQFTTQDSTQLNYFVSDEDEWKSLRQFNQMKANEFAQALNPEINTSTSYASKPIPVLLFFLVFLFASGFLWLAPKI